LQVTIVIPTYKRPHKLKETLNALRLQRNRNFDVIVVDDGSGDSCLPELQEIARGTNPKITLISQINSGAAVATNTGVERAAEGLIILVDDDIILDPEAVQQHLDFHIKNPGAILSGSAKSDPSRSHTDVAAYKAWMETQWLSKRPNARKLFKSDYNNLITTTANTSMMKEVYLGIGGLNPELRDGYDVDFAIRALRNGVDVYYDPEINAIHNDNITLRYYAKRQAAYDRSKKNIASTFPELAQSLLEHASPEPGFIKRLAYFFLSTDAFTNFAEKGGLKFVPRTLRYRLYGNIIAALTHRYS
jgi:glycosyltransferase involved in cell wall biosynthesis